MFAQRQDGTSRGITGLPFLLAHLPPLLALLPSASSRFTTDDCVFCPSEPAQYLFHTLNDRRRCKRRSTSRFVRLFHLLVVRLPRLNRLKTRLDSLLALSFRCSFTASVRVAGGERLGEPCGAEFRCEGEECGGYEAGDEEGGG